MPLLEDEAGADVVVAPENYTICIYGKPKTSKSRWLFEQGAAHHNVVYIDADNASPHTKLVPKEHRHRFAYIPAYKNPMQALSLLSALCVGSHKAGWDENSQTLANLKSTMGDQEAPVVTIDLSKADRSTIVVVDGWNSISQAAYEHFGTEISKGLSDGLFDMVADRSDYKPMYAMLNGILNRLKSLGNLTIVITWEESHIEYDPKSIAPGMAARDAVITANYVQPVSVAHKHSSIFAGYFAQVFRFVTGGMGAKISAKTNASQIAGGSLLAPMEENYAAFPFTKFTELANLRPKEIQPISDVVVYSTLGEARTAKPKTSKPAASSLLKPAVTTVAS